MTSSNNGQKPYIRHHCRACWINNNSDCNAVKVIRESEADCLPLYVKHNTIQFTTTKDNESLCLSARTTCCSAVHNTTRCVRLKQFVSPVLRRTSGSTAADSSAPGWAVCPGPSCAARSAPVLTDASWAAVVRGDCQAVATENSTDTQRCSAEEWRTSFLALLRGETENKLSVNFQVTYFFFIVLMLMVCEGARLFSAGHT